MPSWYFPENLKIRAWCFPKVFSVELCHVIAIFQVTSNLLPTHVAHLCFSPVYYQFKCVLIFHHISGKPLSSVLFQSAIVGRSFTRALGVGRSAGSCGRNRLTRCGTPGKSRVRQVDEYEVMWLSQVLLKLAWRLLPSAKSALHKCDQHRFEIIGHATLEGVGLAQRTHFRAQSALADQLFTSWRAY